MNNLKNFIFDLDGTILNSSDEVMKCFAKAFNQANYAIDKSRLTSNIIGPPLKEIIKMIVPDIDERNSDKVISSFREIYDNDISDISKFYDGIYDFLKDLKNNNCKIFMATFKPHKPTMRIVKQFQLNMFDDIYTIDKFGKNITKTEMINDIILKYNLKKENVVMIGDSYSDMKAAKEAKILGIGVLWGYGDDKSELIKYADYTVKNIEELEKCLKLNYQTI
ncbi:MAG: HAD family hydrolase [Clostridiaceae bacterium]|jgi:phosphoglycolate phosphatase|nr:HAD family hydrolase [Clostridiaceae bacterium]